MKTDFLRHKTDFVAHIFSGLIHRAKIALFRSEWRIKPFVTFVTFPLSAFSAQGHSFGLHFKNGLVWERNRLFPCANGIRERTVDKQIVDNNLFVQRGAELGSSEPTKEGE